jgi:aminoglycoside 2''-phosphotransferase
VTPDWQAIESENRGLRVQSASYLGEGWNSSAFSVNQELVFRFPKRADVWDEIGREIAFLRWAAGRLPLEVPEYLRTAAQSAAAPHGYAVYRYLPGQPLDVAALSSRRRSDIVVKLAEFLRAMHRLEPPPDVLAILPHDEERASVEDYRIRVEREIVPRLQSGEARDLLKHFDASLEPSGGAVVLHADASADHILIGHGTVTGILDFGDVNLGGADYDFTYLFMDFGWPFVEDVARRYQHPDVDRLARNVRFFAIVDQIDTIVNGEGRAGDGQIATAWKRLRGFLSVQPPFRGACRTDSR